MFFCFVFCFVLFLGPEIRACLRILRAHHVATLLDKGGNMVVYMCKALYMLSLAKQFACAPAGHVSQEWLKIPKEEAERSLQSTRSYMRRGWGAKASDILLQRTIQNIKSQRRRKLRLDFEKAVARGPEISPYEEYLRLRDAPPVSLQDGHFGEEVVQRTFAIMYLTFKAHKAKGDRSGGVGTVKVRPIVGQGGCANTSQGQISAAILKLFQVPCDKYLEEESVKLSQQAGQRVNLNLCVRGAVDMLSNINLNVEAGGQMYTGDLKDFFNRMNREIASKGISSLFEWANEYLERSGFRRKVIERWAKEKAGKSKGGRAAGQIWRAEEARQYAEKTLFVRLAVTICVDTVKNIVSVCAGVCVCMRVCVVMCVYVCVCMCALCVMQVTYLTPYVFVGSRPEVQIRQCESLSRGI